MIDFKDNKQTFTITAKFKVLPRAGPSLNLIRF